MTNIFKFVLMLPFKNRTIGFIILLVLLVLFFRYFELQPAGEKKDISVGPITFHVNPIEIHRRNAKPIAQNNEVDASTITPTLPASTIVQTQSQQVSKPIDPPTVVTQYPDGRFHPTIPVSYAPPAAQPLQSEILDEVFTAPAPAQRTAIRIGTVCLDNMNATKMSDPVVFETLVQTARQFDLLAVQGFVDVNLNAVKMWVNALNTNGSTFGYLAVYPPAFKQDKNYRAPYVAFIYNRRAVDADKNTLLVLDAGERMICAPIAALFTSRSSEGLPAFTFIALNVWIAPNNAKSELAVLPQIFPTIQKHIRGEDDILILGDFGININYDPDIVRNPQFQWIFTSPIINYRNGDVTANMLFYDNSCTEFLQQAGTLNIEKLMGLTPTQIQPFMPAPPLWGNFNVSEMRKK